MRGKLPKHQLLFDPEIERTARKLNSKTRKRRQLVKQRNQHEGTSTSTSSTTPISEEVMAEEVIIKGPCVNSPRRNAHVVRPTQNARNHQMKTGLHQILYVNPFTGLDHEDPYTHLNKFYEIVSTLGPLEVKEEQVFMILFPHSLIEKEKEWYLDQATQIMTDWNML